VIRIRPEAARQQLTESNGELANPAETNLLLAKGNGADCDAVEVALYGLVSHCQRARATHFLYLAEC
jgi:hypothetical protein